MKIITSSCSRATRYSFNASSLVSVDVRLSQLVARTLGTHRSDKSKVLLQRRTKTNESRLRGFVLSSGRRKASCDVFSTCLNIQNLEYIEPSFSLCPIHIFRVRTEQSRL